MAMGNNIFGGGDQLRQRGGKTQYMLFVRSATSSAASQQRRSVWFGNEWEWVNEMLTRAEVNATAFKRQKISIICCWYARLLPLMQTNNGGRYDFAMI